MKKKQETRSNFRKMVFERDNHQCRICDKSKNLDAHHIIDRHDIPNGGYILENGITLCEYHHGLAETYHVTNGISWSEGLHPNDLFIMIGSSKELAFRCSERLSDPI